MQGDIIRELLKELPDSEVVGELSERSNLLQVVRERRPDVVVIGLRETEVGPDWNLLFGEHPHLQVMAFTPDGRRVGLFTEPVPRDLLAGVRKR